MLHVVLVGADLEENLALGMLGAVARAAGHQVDLVPFDEEGQIADVAERVVALAPDVVGLSMQFQHRAHEFLRLGAALRKRGFRGHLTCGGQFPTMAWEHVLASPSAFDSVVLHDGEETFAALLSALEHGASLDTVRGLGLAGEPPRTTGGRPLPEDLDALPFPRRYRPHTRHLGIPFIPVLGGRGCWGSCSYCSITTFYRDARAQGGGKLLRMRSPENVAEEMALLWHASGGPAIFCFHDDNFLLPRKRDSLERVTRMRAHLDALGVGRAALVGKTRPECIDAELARDLAKLGVIRLYVGVENASVEGSTRLARQAQVHAIRKALAACREAGIFSCYNLLVFEPGTRLEDVRKNVAFIREHADFPVNFCRAEPYHATPLHRDLEARGKLLGSVLGWDYRIDDDRAELLFRITAAAFRHRNFAEGGVANRYMGLGYAAKLVETFAGGEPARRASIVRRAKELTRVISEDTADQLEDALRLAETVDLADRERIERETALLGLRIAAADRIFHARLDEMFREMEDFARSTAAPRRRPFVPQKLARFAEGVGVAAMMGALATQAFACGGGTVDPVPQDSGGDQWVVDPPPYDAGVMDARPDVRDAADEDAGMVVDPPPQDAGMQGALDLSTDPSAPTDHWRDSAPRRAVRSDALPLFDPPQIRLSAARDGKAVRVTLVGAPAGASTRWEAEGDLEGADREVLWEPASDDDVVAVAVRSRGGVAVTLLRARDVG
jgi:radical SAM superfamily enzyme YgiQ (UPF0313 family)